MVKPLKAEGEWVFLVGMMRRQNPEAEAAWSALATIRHVRFAIDGERRSGVTPGSSRARQVLKALQLTHLRPPTPPAGE